MPDEAKTAEQAVIRIEREGTSPTRFAVQFILAPALLLMLGFLFNQEIQARDRKVKEIEVANHLLDSLFSEKPEKREAARDLLVQLLGKDAARDLITTAGGELARTTARNDIALAEKYAEPEALRQQGFHVIVATLPSLDSARRKAREFPTERELLQIHRTTSDLYVLTVGSYSLERAKEELQRAKRIGAPDAFASNGMSFVGEYGL